MARKQKHLLVDGWNVIHSDPAMKAVLVRDGQEGAKRLLSERLAAIHDSLGLRLTIVYDGRGDEISVERVGRSLTFSEVYTPSSMSADELIEQFCAGSKDPDSLIVASRDNMIRLTVRGFRVESISSAQLLQWAAGAGKNVSRKGVELKLQTDIQWQRSSDIAHLDEIIERQKGSKKRD